MKLTLALAQVEVLPQDPQANFKTVETWVKKAAEQKADLVVFPEDVFTGPLKKDTDLIDQAPQFLQACQELAQKYQIDLVPGSIITRVREKTYNVCSYIDKNGNILGQYRKMNLWHPEKSFITPGEETMVIDTRFGKIGLLICWDLIFPEMFRLLRRQGARLILCPSYWLVSDGGKGLRHNPQSEKTLIDAVSTARAFENDIFFAFINAGGHYKGRQADYPLVGGTQITAPFIGPLKKMKHTKAGLLIQDIDTTDIHLDSHEVYGTHDDALLWDIKRKPQ